MFMYVSVFIGEYIRKEEIDRREQREEGASKNGRSAWSGKPGNIKEPSIDNRATGGQRRIRQTKGDGGGEKRSTYLSSS